MDAELAGPSSAAFEPHTEDATVLEALAAVTQAFTRARDLQPALDRLLASVLQVVQADAGSVMLYSAQDDQLRVVAARGPRAELIDGTSQPAHRSVAGWVLRTQQRLVLRGREAAVSDHPRDLSSSVIIPLQVGERGLGVLNVSRQPGAPDMDDRTVRLLQLLADQAAILIDSMHARSEVRAILDATDEAIALVNADHHTLSINRRFGELFAGGLIDAWPGPTEVPLEVVRQRVGRTFADAGTVQTLLADSPEDGERQVRESLVQSWPKQRELEVFSTPVEDGNGARLGRLLVFRDVTPERTADRMKTEFVSLVSHELRTPLTSIQGFVSLLLDGEVGALSPAQQECLGTVRSNADRLLGLVNELLDLSRITSGMLELRPERLLLGPIVEEVARTLQPQINARQHRLSIHVPPVLPAVWGDPARITQILMNLLSNATKYTPPGGDVTVIARRDGERIRVEVRDTGIGLSREEQAQVFTRFFRANNATARAVAGTGLGLAITRSLVELQGGQMAVSSEPGQGSTFSFTLPTHPSAAAIPTDRLAA